MPPIILIVDGRTPNFRDYTPSQIRDFVRSNRDFLIFFLEEEVAMYLEDEGEEYQDILSSINEVANDKRSANVIDSDPNSNANNAIRQLTDTLEKYSAVLQMFYNENSDFEQSNTNTNNRRSKRIMKEPASQFDINQKRTKREDIDMITLNPIPSGQATITLDNGRTHAYSEIKNFEQSTKIKTPYNYEYTSSDREKIDKLMNFMGKNGGKRKTRKSRKSRKGRKSRKSRKGRKSRKSRK